METVYADHMTSGTAATRARGRPLGFDEDEVLDALVALFWEHGFEAASLSDIVQVAGLNKSSLYNTFGSKDQVFVRALERYVAARGAMLRELTDGSAGLDDLLAAFEAIREETTSERGAHGCLAVNTSTELGLRNDQVRELSERYRSSMRDGFRQPLQRAAELGEIPSELVETYVDMVQAFTVSLVVTARSAAPPAELHRQIDSMRTLIESWRSSGP